MSVGGMFGGGSSSQHQTSSQTTPWTNLANQLSGTLKSGLTNIASGSNLTSWIKSISDSFKQTTKSGIADIKSTFAATGMAGSTDLMRNISNFQTQQSVAEASAISRAQQTNVQDVLASLSEIISLGSGSVNQSGHVWGDQFDWGVNFGIGKH